MALFCFGMNSYKCLGECKEIDNYATPSIDEAFFLFISFCWFHYLVWIRSPSRQDHHGCGQYWHKVFNIICIFLGIFLCHKDEFNGFKIYCWNIASHNVYRFLNKDDYFYNHVLNLHVQALFDKQTGIVHPLHTFYRIDDCCKHASLRVLLFASIIYQHIQFRISYHIYGWFSRSI